MEIRAYIYIETDSRKLCFKCAVKEIMWNNTDNYNLSLEAGRTGDGNDMRSAPECASCGKRLEDFCLT